MGNTWLKLSRQQRVEIAIKLFEKHRKNIESQIISTVMKCQRLIEHKTCPRSQKELDQAMAAAKEFWLHAVEDGIKRAAWDEPEPNAQNGAGQWVDEKWDIRFNCCGYIADILLTGVYEKNTPERIYITLSIETDRGQLY